MLKFAKNIGAFEKNIILVFLGTTVVNVFNLLYQLLIAHRLSPVDFAGFNSLLALFTLISAPLSNIQTAVAKYTAEFNAQDSRERIRALLLGLSRYSLLLGLIVFMIFYAYASGITGMLKISSLNSGYLLAAIIALSWLVPLFSGALQGLELFKWLVSVSVIAGALKLILTIIFINLGFNISGALGAFLISSILLVITPLIPLNRFMLGGDIRGAVDFKSFFYFLLPVAISSFSFMAMVNIDMLMVKYFFAGSDAGSYALAQMVGKIFLFFPAAIIVVMFPRTAGLNVRNMDTRSTLSRSLFYAACLCILANAAYNLFPDLILRVLTGKTSAGTVILARLFGVSMTFFTLMYLLVNYFLSLKDLRFLKILVPGAAIQFLAIALFHKTLVQVQLIMCVNAVLMFILHALLAYKVKKIITA